MKIGEFIHYRRKELGLTLEQVGEYVGVSKSTVKKWETGYISNMRRDKIALLASILKVKPTDLICDGEIASSVIEALEEKKNALPDDDSALNTMILERFLKLTPENRLALLEYLERLIRGQEGK